MWVDEWRGGQLNVRKHLTKGKNVECFTDMCDFLPNILFYRITFQWDECLMTMSVGEKAEVTIEPEWAYGRKGAEGYPLSKKRNLSFSFAI